MQFTGKYSENFIKPCDCKALGISFALEVVEDW